MKGKLRMYFLYATATISLEHSIGCSTENRKGYIHFKEVRRLYINFEIKRFENRHESPDGVGACLKKVRNRKSASKPPKYENMGFILILLQHIKKQYVSTSKKAICFGHFDKVCLEFILVHLKTIVQKCVF